MSLRLVMLKKGETYLEDVKNTLGIDSLFKMM